jgi:hypothetical protein
LKGEVSALSKERNAICPVSLDSGFDIFIEQILAILGFGIYFI